MKCWIFERWKINLIWIEILCLKDFITLGNRFPRYLVQRLEKHLECNEAENWIFHRWYKKMNDDDISLPLHLERIVLSCDEKTFYFRCKIQGKTVEFTQTFWKVLKDVFEEICFKSKLNLNLVKLVDTNRKHPERTLFDWRDKKRIHSSRKERWKIKRLFLYCNLYLEWRRILSSCHCYGKIKITSSDATLNGFLISLYECEIFSKNFSCSASAVEFPANKQRKKRVPVLHFEIRSKLDGDNFLSDPNDPWTKFQLHFTR